MLQKDLSILNRLIEDALVVAVEMEEETTIYLLSMASIEVTERIRAVSRTVSDDAE
jgi:hypothetical protein